MVDSRALPATEELVRGAAEYWSRVAGHPFLRAIARGRLDNAVFARWVAADHAFNVEYLRFAAGLLALSPSVRFSRVLVRVLRQTEDMLGVLERTGSRHGVDLGLDPGPATLALSSYLRASLSRGFGVAVTALYCAERVYFEAWSRLRPKVQEGLPYAELVASLFSDGTREVLTEIGGIVDLVYSAGPTVETRLAFEMVIRLELLFWSEVFVGPSW